MTDTTHRHGDQHQHGQGHGHGHGGTAGGIAEILELDAEVLAERTASIVSWLPVDQSPRRIVDLGCGTGVGTFVLLAQFPDAHVTAVDADEDHLHRVQEKAREAGLAEQIDTVRADLDAEWPALGTPDLVWASASLHHLGDPDRALRRVRDILAPGGLLVVIESNGFPRFLPHNAPEQRPGLEARAHEAADRRAGAQMPHRGADFGPILTAAGFTVEGRRTITDTIDQSRSDAVARYALIGLTNMRNGSPTRSRARTSPPSTSSSTPTARTACCTATTSRSAPPAASGPPAPDRPRSTSTGFASARCRPGTSRPNPLPETPTAPPPPGLSGLRGSRSSRPRRWTATSARWPAHRCRSRRRPSTSPGSAGSWPGWIPPRWSRASKVTRARTR